MDEEWPDFAGLLRSAGAPGNDVFLKPEEASQALYTALMSGLEFNRDQRLGRVMGSFERPRPNRAEARRSERSLRNVVLSLEALRDMARALADGPMEDSEAAFAQALERAEALDDHRVKFTFAEGISRRSLIDQVGSTPVFPKAWYDENEARLDEPRLEAAPGSGAYQVASYDVNRRVVYERNPDYWGKDLPINRGRHNFDRIRIEYFADDSAAFEAFKAGEYTFRAETNSKTWATGYQFPAVDKGWVRLCLLYTSPSPRD